MIRQHLLGENTSIVFIEDGSDDRFSHLNNNFVTRKCWGTKFTFLLDENDSYYRNPNSDWLHLDANLTVVTKEGKITEIIVDNPETNGNYFASQIIVQGTGSEVDAIPVFDEFGLIHKLFSMIRD